MGRYFLTDAAVLLCMGALAACGSEAPVDQGPDPADTVFTSGRVYVADGNQTIHEAIAVRGEDIVFVGSDARARAFVGDGTALIDLEGRLVLPGLHDTHIHPVASIAVEGCDLENEPLTLAEISSLVADCLVEYSPNDGDWLKVELWNFAVGNQAGGGFDTIRAALDAVSRDIPVMLLGSDGHHYAANSAALALARNADGEAVGISRETIDTEFAELAEYIGRDAQGEPNGRLTETYILATLTDADALISDPEQVLANPEGFYDVTLANGITSVLDAYVEPGGLAVYDALLPAGLKNRVTLALFFDPSTFVRDDGSTDYDAILGRARALREKYAGVENIDATFLKLFADGVLEGDPLASPPTLPNAAFSYPYLQPVFRRDEETGGVAVASYVDTGGPVCEALRSETGGTDAGAFRAEHGFHPSQCTTNRGVLQHPEGVIMDYVRAGDAAGFTFLIHAIGDRAVSVSLNAIEGAKAANGGDQSHIVTHLHMVSPEDYPRFAELDVYASFTFAWAVTDPIYDMTIIPFLDDLTAMSDLYDPSGYYLQSGYPAGAIQEAGGTLLAGSDAPVDTRDPRPFVNIAAAVSRRTPGLPEMNAAQGITIHEAIASYTVNAAKALGQADIAGSLEAGKKADLIIVDRDIVALAESGRVDEINDTLVLETWFAGEKVFERGE